MRVAIDLEEVLADTIRESCRSTDKLEPRDFHEWDLDSYTWEVYSGVSDALWRHDPMSIPPVETKIGELVDGIYTQVDELDIVTARLHVDGSVENWLDQHTVPYDSLVSTDQPKYELDYDVYIDDNPEMFNECRLLLRDHPHNAHLDADDVKTCDRIYSLAEVPAFL